MNKIDFLQHQSNKLLLFSLLILLCSCKVTHTTLSSQTTTTAPIQEAGERTEHAIIDDGEVNGPGKEMSYAPTEYVELPVKRTQNVPLPNPSNGCNFIGEVWEFDGEGGCSQVIETTDGHLLSVSGLPQGYYLEGGSRIRFGFNQDNSNSSSCQLADMSIRITCLQLLRSSSGFPRPIVCYSYDQPSQWIYELIRDLSATYVTRFPWKENRVVYLFETPSGQYLYDCRGFILCQPKTNCLQFIEDFSQGKLIYEG